ncbi:aminoglycoside phosphotransferase family protein [Shewanella subflava]|uniref:Aminoglycoside phosphotransferase family protein n=1 Tax=Shewanella subflava TaxID=2986476 RepID=A0ABT3IA57_9GAMM|nr:aminoglycoside phosphotransferase family protein [Shewanella subflava]MCW3172748.1 aminoglycoside phosphotransferase family protein [Shewanella subflava]
MSDFIRQQVLPHYGIGLDKVTISALGNGHINQTFLVRWPEGEFVLQKINTDVFTQPQELIQNALYISEHLQQQRDSHCYKLQVVKPVPTLEQHYGVDLQSLGFWRAITYLPNSHTIEVVNNTEQAKMAAGAFGHFAAALSSLSPNCIKDVINDFLNLPFRLSQLQQAVADDKCQRLAECQQWVDLVFSQTALFEELKLVESLLPLRVCHNDTKINNMLFDKRDMSSMAIIDLDTCMKGYLMYDFGDMVRAFCSPEEEDSTALDKVIARPEIIAAASESYINALDGIITPIEKRSLWLGIKVMALMLGSRFLADHINGDVYFSIHKPHHNLDRAANQLTIFKSLLAQESQLKPLFE